MGIGKGLQRTHGGASPLVTDKALRTWRGDSLEPGVVGTQMPQSDHCVDCDVTRTVEQTSVSRGWCDELLSQGTALFRLVLGKGLLRRQR